MIKDRGNIKWSSLMLTEHRQKLEELYDNDSNIPRPELDEHQLNQMNNILKQALAHDKNIKLKYYKNNKIENYIGEIIKYRAQDRALLLKVNEKNLSFQLKNIIEITF
ncbi:MAG: YolD-like family protein [Halanaerobiaceae bacterium]